MIEGRLADAQRAYAELVTRYHGTLDLVSDAVIERLDEHVADAVAYAQLIRRLVGAETTIVDVGTGAGLPGVIVAAALPDADVHLVERRRRRGAFLQIVKGELGLDNATVHIGDVTRLGGVCADAITAQAVADVATVVGLTRHLHRPDCLLVSRRAAGADVATLLQHAVAAAREFDERSASSGGRGGSLADGRTATDWALAEVLEEPLEGRGSLIAVRLPGGTACQ